ncbi:MAG: hypothetical protein QME96_01445, partial [Myxococcota bacterium]|nr:hypothetical protein [Myxococcota bacterium]
AGLRGTRLGRVPRCTSPLPFTWSVTPTGHVGHTPIHHYDIHGVRVTVQSASETGMAAFHELLRCNRATFQPGLADGHDGAQVHVRLRPRLRRFRPLPAVWTRVLEYLPVVGFRRGRRLRLTDGHTDVTVLGPGRIDGAIAAADLSPPHLVGSYMASLALFRVLSDHGLFHLHAACLVSPGGIPLVVPGDSGIGKTALTLALASAGFRVVSDDAVFLRPGEGDVAAVLPFRRPMHVDDRILDAFPALRPLATDPVPWFSAIRWSVCRRAVFGDRAVEAAPLPRAVLCLRRSSESRSRIERVPRREAFHELLRQSALIMLAGRGARTHLRLLAWLCREAVPLRLTLGRDVLERPGDVARLVASAVDSTGASCGRAPARRPRHRADPDLGFAA